jgi:hypothetical protein
MPSTVTAGSPSPNTFPHGLEPATQHPARRLRELLKNGDLIVRQRLREIHNFPVTSVPLDRTRYSRANSKPNM